MTRQTWRTLFITIIGLTIPCYMIGIGTYFIRGSGTAATATPAIRATNTPIDTDALLTQRADENPTFIATEIDATDDTDPTPTRLTGGGITPIIPTSILPATSTPTQFVLPTNTPIPTQAPTNTLVPSPTETQPVLIPPTDTPSP